MDGRAAFTRAVSANPRSRPGSLRCSSRFSITTFGSMSTWVNARSGEQRERVRSSALAQKRRRFVTGHGPPARTIASAVPVRCEASLDWPKRNGGAVDDITDG